MTLLQDSVPTARHDEPTATKTAPRNLDRRARDERTADLVERLRSCRNEAESDELRRELVAVNLPMARLLSRRYLNRGESDDDLEQVAYVGLVEAARRFDATRASSFPSFCVPTILGGLRRHFRDQGWMVRPPRSMQELQREVQRAERGLETNLCRSPTVAEVAEVVGRTVEEVAEALTLHDCYSPVRLDRPTGPEPDSPTLGELLTTTGTGDAAAEARVILGPLVRDLGERDRRILHDRFFRGLTQREIAEDLGISQMQVSRILGRILSGLRQSIGPT